MLDFLTLSTTTTLSTLNTQQKNTAQWVIVRSNKLIDDWLRSRVFSFITIFHDNSELTVVEKRAKNISRL